MTQAPTPSERSLRNNVRASDDFGKPVLMETVPQAQASDEDRLAVDTLLRLASVDPADAGATMRIFKSAFALVRDGAKAEQREHDARVAKGFDNDRTNIGSVIAAAIRGEKA